MQFASSLSQDGATPLIIASQKGHSDVVNILLRSGADVNLACNVSNDMIMLTIHIVIENMLVKLMEYGQDLVCMTVQMTVESSSRYYFSGNQSM